MKLKGDEEDRANQTFGTRFKVWLQHHYKEVILVAILLGISGLAHAWNMFEYPYYENDEATYTSRAWSVVHEGKLDVYTYRYDHAPLGWMLLGAWQLVSGGAHSAGSLLANGRVFMLVLQLASSILIYILAKRLSGGSKLAGSVAVLFFALSPLALYFHRRVLLDNIMTFWLLVSLYFATQPVQRLKYYILSGVTFGVAVLTKLNAIFIAPAILYVVWIRSHHRHRLHAAAYWLTITSMVIICFFMYALLKGEFFSAPLGPDGNPTHVSVMNTFALQLGRGDFAWPWQTDSSFMLNVRSWLLKDWSILAFGTLATIFLTLIGAKRRKKQPYILALVGIILLYIAFLARGKIVIDLYIVPLLPFFALAIGLLVGIIYNDWIKNRFVRYAFLFAGALTLTSLYGVFVPTREYAQNETANQLAAVQWVKAHVPKDAIVATDNYMYPFLAEEDNFKHISYFFSTEYDPEVRKGYGNDWRNIQYLVLTHEVVAQIKTGTVPRMKQIFDHATLVADYSKGSTSYIDLPHYISTNGDWVQIYKVENRNDIVLQDSWQYFKSHFIVDYGQVVDLTNGSLTTSGSQAQAMIRAVTEHDKSTFDGVWQWSKDHLRYRTKDKLLSWKWERKKDGKYALADSNTVCDADQQIAYALYRADEAWPEYGYAAEASVHLHDWWRRCTFELGGKRYVDSSADGSKDNRLLNLGYFRPATYRYLASKAPDLQWGGLIDAGYALCDEAYKQYDTIPDWVVLKVDGKLESAKTLLPGNPDLFGYDALQLTTNLAEDAAVAKEPRASQLLTLLEKPTAAFAATTKSVPGAADLLLVRQVLYAGSKPSTELQKEYETAIYGTYHPGKGYWADGFNYRDHVWLWQWHAMQSKLPQEQRVFLK